MSLVGARPTISGTPVRVSNAWLLSVLTRRKRITGS
jgi:hypothetical protein